jgi:hypothetical protein
VPVFADNPVSNGSNNRGRAGFCFCREASRHSNSDSISILLRLVVMPVLSALDLLEGRGLPRCILLLSDIEAETLDRFEQINHESYKLRGDMGTNDRYSCKQHTRSWKSVGRLQHPSTAKTARAWATAILDMDELRTVALEQAQTRLLSRQPTPPKVPRFSKLPGRTTRLPRHLTLLKTIEAKSLAESQARRGAAPLQCHGHTY